MKDESGPKAAPEAPAKDAPGECSAAARLRAVATIKACGQVVYGRGFFSRALSGKARSIAWSA